MLSVFYKFLIVFFLLYGYSAILSIYLNMVSIKSTYVSINSILSNIKIISNIVINKRAKQFKNLHKFGESLYQLYESLIRVFLVFDAG